MILKYTVGTLVYVSFLFWIIYDELRRTWKAYKWHRWLLAHNQPFEIAANNLSFMSSMITYIFKKWTTKYIGRPCSTILYKISIQHHDLVINFITYFILSTDLGECKILCIDVRMSNIKINTNSRLKTR